MIGSKLEPLLSEIERNSAVWQKLARHIEDRLSKLRAKNDRDHDERKTARLRGGIGELKYLLSLGTAHPLPPPEDEFKD